MIINMHMYLFNHIQNYNTTTIMFLLINVPFQTKSNANWTVKSQRPKKLLTFTIVDITAYLLRLSKNLRFSTIFKQLCCFLRAMLIIYNLGHYEHMVFFKHTSNALNGKFRQQGTDLHFYLFIILHR